MYPYRTVERALTRLHGDTGAASLRITARIKHFIRLGFTPESPGRGQRISYTFENIAKWAYALQILEYGLDPTAMQFVVRQSWDQVWPAMEKGDHGQNDVLIATPRAISHPNSWAAFDFMVVRAGQPAYQHMAMSLDFFRQMKINLSMLSRHLRAALDEAEAGMLRDLSQEIAAVKAGEAVAAHIAAALQNATPGAELHVGSVNGGPLVQERGPEGELRELPPTPSSTQHIEDALALVRFDPPEGPQLEPTPRRRGRAKAPVEA